MESTALSESFEIVPSEAIGVELAGANFITVIVEIHNTGQRPLYLDGGYSRLEKLVNQKWRVATEELTPFSPGGALAAGASRTIKYSATYDRSAPGDDHRLAHLRGVYRIRFRIFFDAAGTDAAPAMQSYSRPFGINCC